MAANSKNIGTLEEEAIKRRERLKNLKRKQTDSEEATKESEQKESIPLPKPKFRSYKPQDEGLKEHALPNTKPGNVEEEVEEQLKAAKSKVVIEELDIASLAPRKPDWDLKRDVAKKLERLDRRTQKAIAELIRERLKQRQDNLDMVVGMASMKEKSKLVIEQ